MILNSFLELLQRIAFFEDIAESNLSIFDFDIQEKEFVRMQVSNEPYLTKELVSAARNFVSDGGRIHYIKV